MEKIAIVGLGCLFPGAQTPDQFWRIVQDGIDVSSPLSEAELGVDPALYFSPQKGQIDKINYNRNGYIRDFAPDLSGYRIPESRLQKLDKLFHWTLYSAHQALKDAGYAEQERGGKCGLILGNINMPTHTVKHLAAPYYNQLINPLVSELIGADFRLGSYWPEPDQADENMLIGSHSVVIAAQALGLTGPTFGLDAACSSAIYAIELARQYLLSGHADMMLAGATCHVDHIVINHGFNILQAYPDAASGESVPFSRDSKGLKGGEGAGVVALKRLSDAKRDGDPIYAVIETIGLSNDAGAKHVLVPDETGQKLAMQRAYAQRQLPVDYIECHATGTDVGDGVELNSIAHFFADRPDLPKVGANKSNFGHMLTAASMASIFKVVLGMQHAQIPATIGVTEFIGSTDQSLNETHLVDKLTEWPERDNGATKYGAINAFGFGGVNAHLCLSTAWDDQPDAIPAPTDHLATEELAIIGMSVNVPGQIGLRGFDRMIQKGKQQFIALPEARWSGVEQNKGLLANFGLQAAPRGAYADHFAFDCRRYKIPPNVAGLHLLSHLSMLPMAERAYLDAGYPLDGRPRNIAVLIAGDSDLNSLRYQTRLEMAWQIRDTLTRQQLDLSAAEISELETIVKDAIFPEPHVEGITGGISNMVASRISAYLKLNGPAFTLQSHENSALVALQVAQILIRGGHVEAAIVGAGSFSGSAENVLFNHRRSPLSPHQDGLPLMHSEGWLVGEGGGIVVVKSAGRTSATDRVYARIKALEILKSPGDQPDAASVRQAAQQALSDASVSADQIDYLEVHASGIPAEDHAERTGLAGAYQARQQTPLAIGSVKTNMGHTQGASAILSLIKTALCLYGRYLPASANAAGQDHGLDRQFVLPGHTQARPEMRYAALNSLGLDQNYAHLVLEAADSVEHEPLDSKTLAWEQEYRKGLLKEVWVSGERTYQQHILDPKHVERFAAVRARLQPLQPAEPFQVTGNEPATPYGRQFVRNLRTHHAYLATQQTMLARLRELMGQEEDWDIGSGAIQTGVMTGNLRVPPTEKQAYRHSRAGGNLSGHHPTSMDSRLRGNDEGDAGSFIRPAPEPIPFRVSPRSANALFNEEQLREMTDGKVANVLGEQYAAADQYPIRTRMPSLPFNFVSRITRLTAEYGVLKPCTIEWEYDIPQDAWYLTGFMLPSFVSLESSHAMIVAYTVIGCDEMFKGELSYRAVNSSTQIFSDFPVAGDILRGHLDITSFKRMRSNILVDYTYRCYVGERLCFELKASSGFFNRADINEAKGMSTKAAFARAEKQPRPALLEFVTRKTAFDEKAIAAFGQGRFSQCFDPAYQDIPMPVFRPSTQMVDRVVEVQPDGGPWGLGYALGEARIDPNHWAFDAHFKNDPCMPGTLIVEGCEQMMKFYMAYLGFSSLSYLRHKWSHDILSTAKFRGEVKRRPATLGYRFTVKAFDMQRKDERVESIFLNAVIEVLYDDKIIGLCDDMSVAYEAVDEEQHKREKEMYLEQSA